MKPITMRASSKTAHHSVDISEEDGVRSLHFGSDWVQGAMRIARPWSLELAYTREMMAGLLMRQNSNWPRRALLIGLGAGSLAKFVYRYLPDCRSTVVEINPQVVFAAQQFFKLPEDPRRLEIVVQCGADYLLACKASFDLILVDGFDPDARAGVLDTDPFYQVCRARLTEQGLCVFNLLGRNRIFPASVGRIKTAFDGRVSVFPSTDSGNVIAFAVAGAPVDVSLDEMRTRADALRASTRLNLLPTITRLQLSQALPAGRLQI